MTRSAMRALRVYWICMESDSSAALRVADHSLDLPDVLGVLALEGLWMDEDDDAAAAEDREREADLAMLRRAME